DAVEGTADIESARAERVVRASLHVGGEIGPPLAHRRRRRPARPFRLAADAVGAGPLEALAADADAELHRGAVAADEIQAPLRRVDDDRVGAVRPVIVDDLARHRAARA